MSYAHVKCYIKLSNRQIPSLEDWNDESDQVFVCLFCEKSFETEDTIINHMNEMHDFNFKSIITSNNLSFYDQVKILNFIRRQVNFKSAFKYSKYGYR